MSNPLSDEIRCSMVQRQADNLIQMAQTWGVVLEIELVPVPDTPPAMGNYTMVARVRPEREMS